MYKLILLHVTEPCLIRFGPELFQTGSRRMECKIFISGRRTRNDENALHILLVLVSQ